MSNEKQFIKAPDIPNIVAGDGRYFAGQLRKYLAIIAEQVNLANGFQANEEIGTSGIAPPPHFTLTFSMEGGLFQWSHPTYLDRVKYYEIRKDTNVGTISGLIDRTVENHSTKMPNSYAGTVFLYAVLKDGTASNGSRLDYSKARPVAPQDISLTQNDQGTLVNYTWVPLDCMGAHIYIDGVMFETPDNWFLYTGNADKISEVSVAYYDCFGEGERSTIYCKVPTVKGFIVERNGAVLDFYWESVGINGASYEVRSSQTNQWINGIKIFETGLLKKKMEYPKTGDVYFLIKAKDEHGNYSKEAAWFLLSTKADQQKNIILETDEDKTSYSGNKIGVYYDTRNHGLRLTDGVFEGEYITAGHLPYKAIARSWAEASVLGISDSSLTVNDLTFPCTDDRAKLITAVGGTITDTGDTDVKTYLSVGQTTASEADVAASLNGSIKTATGESPAVSDNVETFDYGRWFKGLKQSELTRLKYAIPTPISQFHLTFNIRFNNGISPCTILMLKGEGTLELIYDGAFRLIGSDGKINVIHTVVPQESILSIGISQTDTKRSLFIKVSNMVLSNIVERSEIDASPVGKFQYVSFYKEIS